MICYCTMRERARDGFAWYSTEMVCLIKNIQLKSGITFSFKWKRSNYSGTRVLIFCFNVFIRKCYGLALTIENIAPLPANIPTLTSPIVPQVWLHNLPVHCLLMWRRRWHEVLAGIRKCVLWQVNSMQKITIQITMQYTLSTI